MFETLLLNFLFLLVPVVIYLIFFENSSYTYDRRIFVLLSTVAMILCLAKPIQLDIGYIFDLRYIPFVLVALFGGYKNAIPIYVVLNTCRFYIGGNGIVFSFLYSTAFLILIPLLHPRFIRLSSRNRIIAATTISFFNVSCYLSILSFTQYLHSPQYNILVWNALITYGGMTGILMLLIEKIMTNTKNRDRILQSERLNVVSELAASVSHEIRNPLTVTSGFLQLLNRSKTLTSEEKGYVEMSLQELERAEKIVSDYLSFAKPQTPFMVFSDLSAELEYTKNIIVPYASIHKVEVVFSFHNTLTTIYDRNQIQQCLINLYKNGIEAMKETGGGTLFIDISEKKQQIIISICDTGVGMSKEEISRLGKPYYSTKAEGTGLGMLMVYTTIHKLKGKIEVVSDKGKGTTFLITIPT
ncbi:two-component system sporulation sensor kinase B [Paenibacillus shirakamiensis]|uniref:histidine kinase n=1 Tax=Paenibacillus shirakamiensis TaxID=1265935 RepID=A0ABS4JKL1_9BACL|nr:ATP-binding protein [Paenibacillus shirakamiensis]MBP2002254.1 two-component system sporulation sensor kinase B [Paenibacillus shirakamiensis]